MSATHVRAALLMSGLLVLSCQGQDAADFAICRDVIHRVCIPPVCERVVPLFPAGSSCEQTLQMRTGCSDENFLFTSPSRERFLTCRLSVLRAGDNPEAKPSCGDVSELFASCPDVLRMFEGTK